MTGVVRRGISPVALCTNRRRDKLQFAVGIARTWAAFSGDSLRGRGAPQPIANRLPFRPVGQRLDDDARGAFGVTSMQLRVESPCVSVRIMRNDAHAPEPHTRRNVRMGDDMDAGR